MIRIPKSPAARQAILVTIGSALVTAAPFVVVPSLPWLQGLMFTVGGLLGGKALLQRPGDVKAGT